MRFMELATFPKSHHPHNALPVRVKSPFASDRTSCRRSSVSNQSVSLSMSATSTPATRRLWQTVVPLKVIVCNPASMAIASTAKATIERTHILELMSQQLPAYLVIRVELTLHYPHSLPIES
ncbi:hypothetical protein PMAYCL1PPCAC_00264 [Pristionchus mayeri]|uniref:Uncharacterized protein n=1 Tax=Pristionchus mayeri TaxID=1317129 RepID=A0AAN4YYI9_9BILA|nr:hypothetical protein PMAYCL1PPCAC_00264 [Pristionchus mayeri]